jgi:hypothetical protein
MDPTLAPIATHAVAQYGALAFMAVSGWVVAWFLWGALTKARAELAAQGERILTALTNNTQAMTLLAERLQGNRNG